MNTVKFNLTGEKWVKILSPLTKENFLKMEEQTNLLVANVMNAFNALKADPTDKSKKEAYNNAKKQLPMLNFNLFAQKATPLKGARYILGKASVFGVDYDLDPYIGFSDFEERHEKLINDIMAKAKANNICMVQRTPKGAHVAALRDPGLSQLENIKRLDIALGLEHDTNAEDPERVFYHYGKANTPLLDDRMFDTKPVAPPDVDYNKACAHTLSPVASASDASMPTAAPAFASTATAEPRYLNKYPFSMIVGKYWQLYNNGQTPVEGQRDKLTYQLASDLYPLCNCDINMLKCVVPIYDGFPLDEWEKKFESAQKTSQEGIPWRIQRVLKALDAEKEAKETPPPMPRRLPQVVKDVTSLTPTELKPTVAAAMWAPFSAYLEDVTYPYIDGSLSPSNVMSVLVAQMSEGKGCVEQPIKYIISDLLEEDKPNREKEREWVTAQRKGKTNAARPRVPIRITYPDMTQPILTERCCASEENGRYNLYTHGPELNELSKLDTRGKQNSINQFINSSFDNSAMGQERWMADAMSGGAPVRFSFNFSCTPTMFRQILPKYTLLDGAVTRLLLITVPKLDPHKMPCYGKYSEAYHDLLTPYIEHLRAAHGQIKCAAIFKLFRKMQLEIADRYEKMGTDTAEGEVFWSFAKRALVIAYRIATELYIIQGKWDKVSEKFIRWLFKYDIWCKMHFLGDELKSLMTSERHRNFSRTTIYDMPEYFTRYDVVKMQLKPNTVDQWVRRGKVENLGDGNFHRLM